MSRAASYKAVEKLFKPRLERKLTFHFSIYRSFRSVLDGQHSLSRGRRYPELISGAGHLGAGVHPAQTTQRKSLRRRTAFVFLPGLAAPCRESVQGVPEKYVSCSSCSWSEQFETVDRNAHLSARCCHCRKTLYAAVTCVLDRRFSADRRPFASLRNPRTLNIYRATRPSSLGAKGVWV